MLVPSNVLYVWENRSLTFVPQQTTPPVVSTTSPSDSPPASPLAGGLETVTAYDQRGFPTVVTQVKGATKHYNEQGFLITSPIAARSSPTAANVQAAESAATTSDKVVKITKSSAAAHEREWTLVSLTAGCSLAMLGGILAL